MKARRNYLRKTKIFKHTRMVMNDSEPVNKSLQYPILTYLLIVLYYAYKFKRKYMNPVIWETSVKIATKTEVQKQLYLLSNSQDRLNLLWVVRSAPTLWASVLAYYYVAEYVTVAQRGHGLPILSSQTLLYMCLISGIYVLNVQKIIMNVNKRVQYEK